MLFALVTSLSGDLAGHLVADLDRCPPAHRAQRAHGPERRGALDRDRAQILGGRLQPVDLQYMVLVYSRVGADADFGQIAGDALDRPPSILGRRHTGLRWS